MNSDPILLQLVAKNKCPSLRATAQFAGSFHSSEVPILLRHLVGEEESRVKRKRRFVTPIAHGLEEASGEDEDGLMIVWEAPIEG